MNVTLRPDGTPDVYIQQTAGQSLSLEQMDAQIRTLLTARRWLKKELDEKKAATK